MSQERRLYFLYLLGVEGWSLESLTCLRRRDQRQKLSQGAGLISAQTSGAVLGLGVSSLGDLLQVVLVAAGILAVLDLFLAPLQNRPVGLGVDRVRQAGVAASVRRPAGHRRVNMSTCLSHPDTPPLGSTHQVQMAQKVQTMASDPSGTFWTTCSAAHRPPVVPIIRPHRHAAGGHLQDAALQDGRPTNKQRPLIRTRAEWVLDQQASCLDRNLRVLVPARSRPLGPLAARGDGMGDVLLRKQKVSVKVPVERRFVSGNLLRWIQVSLPDQTVVHRAAAGEEPRLGGGASCGAGRQVRDTCPDGGGPTLGTNTRPGAETEAERAAESEPAHSDPTGPNKLKNKAELGQNHWF